jgi:hypothetical protein
MYDINSLVTILFRIINFSVFVSIAIYFFKKKVLTSAQEKINEKEVYLKSLQEQDRVLDNQYFQLNEQLRIQNQQCHHLLKKIKVWQSADTAQRTQKIEQSKLNQERMQERTLQIQAMINQKRFERHALLKALAQTKNELQNKFSDQAAGESFLQDIVLNLTRENK